MIMDNILVSMTDFVISEFDQFKKDGQPGRIYKIVKYANFLKQPLTLGMFLPVDGYGNILKRPENIDTTDRIVMGNFYVGWKVRKDRYDKANGNVLFEGFKVIELRQGVKRLNSPCGTYDLFWHNDEKGWYPSQGVEKETIEDLVKYGLTLTPNALKQLQ